MGDEEISHPSLASLAEEARASILVACWSRLGLKVKTPRARRLLGTGLEVVCVVCQGDLCEQVPVHIPFVGGKHVRKAADVHALHDLLPPPSPDASLACRLLTQPIALAALGGMAILTTSCLVESGVTDTLLLPVGGRANGWFVLYAAVAAHAVEAVVAARITSRLPDGSLGAALRWACLVLLTGFPVLQHVL